MNANEADMKILNTATLALIAFMYVGCGMRVNAITEVEMEQHCPGHTHAHDRWPVAVPITRIVIWPATLLIWPWEAYFDFERVCDRFDR